MEDGLEHIDILIAKAATGEASPEEIVELYDWEHQSEENKRYVEQSMKMFERIALIDVDTDAAWNKVKKRIDEDEKPVIPITRQRRLWPYIAAAASVAILIGVFFFMKQQTDPILNQSTITAQATPLKDTLNDGTITLLAANSEITYTETEGKREVKLKGNAFFQVEHKTKPFIINVNDVMIKDIGTAFNVEQKGNTVEVRVEEGIVEFYTTTNKGLTLKAGETGTYNAETKEFIKKDFTPGNNPILRQFNFNGTKLKDVVTQLNMVYNANIVLENNTIADCPITVDFKNESLDNVLNIISMTLNLTVTKEKDKIILSGNGC